MGSFTHSGSSGGGSKESDSEKILKVKRAGFSDACEMTVKEESRMTGFFFFT